MKKKDAKYLIEIPQKRLKRIKSNYDQFISNIEKTQEIMYDRIKSSLKDKYTLGQALAINKQAEKWYKQAGFEKHYTEYTKKLDDLKSENLEYFKEVAKFAERNMDPAYLTIDINALNAFRDQMLVNYDMIGVQATNELRNFLLAELTVGKKAFPEFVKDLEKLITGADIAGGSLKKYSYTYANTAVMQYDRECNARLAKNTRLEYYMYVGGAPIKTTRPFCDRILKSNRVYTKEEILELHNPIARNSFTEAGGWNCRHEWVPVLKSMAEALDYTWK